MKKSVILLLASVAVLAGCAKKFNVQATLDSAKLPATESVVVEYETMEAPIKAAVKDDAFKIAGKAKKSCIAKLSTVGVDPKRTRVFIIEKGDISFQDGLPCGTPLNDSITAFSYRVNVAAKQHIGDTEGLKTAVNKEFSDFVSRHKNDPCAVYAILYGNHRLDKKFLRDLIKSTSRQIQNDGEVHGILSDLENLPD